MSQMIDISGLSPEAVQAVETLVDLLRANGKSQGTASNNAIAGSDNWVTRWHSVIAAHQTSAVADDSRESIYEGR